MDDRCLFHSKIMWDSLEHQLQISSLILLYLVMVQRKNNKNKNQSISKDHLQVNHHSSIKYQFTRRQQINKLKWLFLGSSRQQKLTGNENMVLRWKTKLKSIRTRCFKFLNSRWAKTMSLMRMKAMTTITKIKRKFLTYKPMGFKRAPTTVIVSIKSTFRIMMQYNRKMWAQFQNLNSKSEVYRIQALFLTLTRDQNVP